jgi:hypothetical protein
MPVLARWTSSDPRAEGVCLLVPTLAHEAGELHGQIVGIRRLPIALGRPAVLREIRGTAEDLVAAEREAVALEAGDRTAGRLDLERWIR